MPDNLIPRTPSAYAYPLLIKNLLFAPVADNPDQEIIYADRFRFTYAEFKQRVAKLANALTDLGVKPGDTVAVMDWDSHRYLECFFAVPMIGAVLHTVNVRLLPEQVIYTIDHAEDDFLLINSDFLPLIEKIKGRLNTVKHFIVLQDKEELPKTSITLTGEYEALVGAASDQFTFEDFDENTRATTFYTTGTTGMPKGVYFSHRQLVLHTLCTMTMLATSAEQGRIHQQDVYMPITPMFHVHAWGFPYIATTMGIKQVYPGKYVPANLLQLIDREKVTFSHCVPTILHMLITSPEFATTDLSNWKVVIGGASLPKKLCKSARAKGIDIFTGYGMSETCPVLTIAHVGNQDLDEDAEIERRCKTGRPLPLVQMKILDDRMQEVEPDGTAVGEITVRAPWLTQGYWKGIRNSENLWHGGYLHTGDVANIDARGYVNITDRIKDVIKIGGEWLSSLELEDIINLHESVSEVAVIGMEDDKWSEKPLALVVVDQTAEAVDAKKIIQHVKAYIDKGLMNKLAVLMKVKFVDAIDKTSVGKTDKKLLREKYL
ncbi:fatty acid--CoA ligase [Desulforhopalus singaporensis]|uniref:Fatty-acyl-CoA synthase n=1 Tax=Desulforhopalus singaporensis TaxID=91360 RepID=A0A1H0TYT9_9BACT|nr:fatty acid--CoA ligase [Desulforhopalus singaporensis]SDP59109.1 fatty-acyl-CoA synthase [Desulforhopalus singaporensis]